MRDLDSPQRSAPWWRFGIVWFALAGPALVVVASFATLAIALARADRAIPEVPAATTLSVRWMWVSSAPLGWPVVPEV